MKKGSLTSVFGIALFVFVLAGLTVFAFLLPLRPTKSTVEKRELAKFPEFSLQALLSGDYFSDISLWFSDTVPLRDNIMTLSNGISDFLGSSLKNTGFNEGVKGDEIPDEPPTPVIITTSPAVFNEETDTTQTQETTVTQTTEAPVTESPEDSGEQMGNIFVYGNAGYEYYNFNNEVAVDYIATINRAYAVLGDKANIYEMVVPTSIEIILSPQIQSTLSVSNQQKAIEYMYKGMLPQIKTVDVYTSLLSHNKEYVYFRTDHHWTGLGAYYAYCEFCKAKGIAALTLDRFTLKSYEGFLGSFYNDSGQSPKLGNTPDRVDAYMPPCNTVMTVTDKSGATAVRPLIYNADNSNTSNKYSAFIYGDNPLSVIENTDLTEGETCLLIKESFGNALAPYLTPHYKYVIVADYRYINNTLSELVERYQVNDVLFCNNISMTRGSNPVKLLGSFVGG